MGKQAIVLASLATLLAAGFGGQGDGFRRERSGESAAKKDALEGNAPPALPAADWVNTGGEPLNWKGLAGNVVILDFWAHW